MKAIVKVGFKDKHTGMRYARGNTIEVSAERFREILEKGDLVEAIKEKAGGEPPMEDGKTVPKRTRRKKGAEDE